jgi:hypothetical protein
MASQLLIFDLISQIYFTEVIMKRFCIILCIISLATFSGAAAFADNLCDTYPDPENHTWFEEWTDGLGFGLNVYRLEAPCKVFVDIPFDITVTVTDDPFFANTWIGGLWDILDTPDGGSTSSIAHGFSIWLDENAFWTVTVSQTYTGAPVNHTVEFSFIDFGWGSGGHNWAGGVIGGIVVDPYPEECNDSDGDGICDEDDICPGGNDNDNIDGDEFPDFCDACPIDPENDSDGDGICELDDNCPLIANEDQFDTDEDGEGNACDADDDNDGVSDGDDNCQYDVNVDQADYDNDGLGDVCDTDVDGDGVLDATDQCIITTPGEVVNDTGCSIADLCSCENPWKNHGAYVSCVAHTSGDFVSAGLITEIDKDAIVSEAGGSSCGYKK